MDIQVSSNFERALFEAEGRNSATVRRQMAGLQQSGSFAISETARAALAETFSSGRADEAETAATMTRIRRAAGVLIDPHTAVGVPVAERHLGAGPMVALATAHPAKFPEAVEAACGEAPELPDRAKRVMRLEESFPVLPADLAAVEREIEAHTRASHAVA
jgi:threonine synthase